MRRDGDDARWWPEAVDGAFRIRHARDLASAAYCARNFTPNKSNQRSNLSEFGTARVARNAHRARMRRSSWSQQISSSALERGFGASGSVVRQGRTVPKASTQQVQALGRPKAAPRRSLWRTRYLEARNFAHFELCLQVIRKLGRHTDDLLGTVHRGHAQWRAGSVTRLGRKRLSLDTTLVFQNALAIRIHAGLDDDSNEFGGVSLDVARPSTHGNRCRRGCAR